MPDGITAPPPDTQTTVLGYAFGVFLLSILFASAALANDQAKQLLSLIDYIGGDYKNAVKDGNVINPDEYQEMFEFSKRSIELFDQLKANEGRDTAAIEKDLRTLAAYIKNTSGGRGRAPASATNKRSPDQDLRDRDPSQSDPRLR